MPTTVENNVNHLLLNVVYKESPVIGVDRNACQLVVTAFTEFIQRIGGALRALEAPEYDVDEVIGAFDLLGIRIEDLVGFLQCYRARTPPQPAAPLICKLPNVHRYADYVPGMPKELVALAAEYGIMKKTAIDDYYANKETKDHTEAQRVAQAVETDRRKYTIYPTVSLKKIREPATYFRNQKFIDINGLLDNSITLPPHERFELRPRIDGFTDGVKADDHVSSSDIESLVDCNENQMPLSPESEHRAVKKLGRRYVGFESDLRATKIEEGCRPGQRKRKPSPNEGSSTSVSRLETTGPSTQMSPSPKRHIIMKLDIVHGRIFM